MPLIMCSFCEEIFYGNGLTIQEIWNKAWKHETENHQRELQELEAQLHD